MALFAPMFLALVLYGLFVTLTIIVCLVGLFDSKLHLQSLALLIPTLCTIPAFLITYLGNMVLLWIFSDYVSSVANVDGLLCFFTLLGPWILPGIGIVVSFQFGRWLVRNLQHR